MQWKVKENQIKNCLIAKRFIYMFIVIVILHKIILKETTQSDILFGRTFDERLIVSPKVSSASNQFN